MARCIKRKREWGRALGWAADWGITAGALLVVFPRQPGGKVGGNYTGGGQTKFFISKHKGFIHLIIGADGCEEFRDVKSVTLRFWVR